MSDISPPLFNDDERAEITFGLAGQIYVSCICDGRPLLDVNIVSQMAAVIFGIARSDEIARLVADAAEDPRAATDRINALLAKPIVDPVEAAIPPPPFSNMAGRPGGSEAGQPQSSAGELLSDQSQPGAAHEDVTQTAAWSTGRDLALRRRVTRTEGGSVSGVAIRPEVEGEPKPL